jgi:hypothetical protein
MHKAMILVFVYGFIQGQELTQWVVHYTRIGGGFQTDIQILNVDLAHSWPLTLTPYQNDGQVLSHLVQTIEVPPGQMLTLDRDALGYTGEPVSHLSTYGATAVRVSSVFRHESEGSMPAFTLSRQVPTIGARWVPVSSSNWFDGLVIVNSSGADASIQLESYAADGTLLATRSFVLAGKAKWLDVVDNIFGTDLDQQGFVAGRSSRTVMFFGLRGSRLSEPAVLSELSLDQYVPVAP